MYSAFGTGIVLPSWHSHKMWDVLVMLTLMWKSVHIPITQLTSQYISLLFYLKFLYHNLLYFIRILCSLIQARRSKNSNWFATGNRLTRCCISRIQKYHIHKLCVIAKSLRTKFCNQILAKFKVFRLFTFRERNRTILPNIQIQIK